MRHNTANNSFFCKKLKYYIITFLFVCIFMFCFSACSKNDTELIQQETTSIPIDFPFPEGQRLQLKVTPGNYYGGYDIVTSSRGSNPHVNAVEQVLLYIDGDYIDLGNAVEAGLITVEEMDAYAKLDSKNGFCKMEYASLNGFSLYVYHYDEFDIASYYDVFESPNGSNEHFQRFYISTGNRFSQITEFSVDYPYYPREDWGVAFDVIEATPNYIKMQVSQTGGQHFGELSIGPGFYLEKDNGGHFKEPYYQTQGLVVQKKNSHISNNAITEIMIQWPLGCKNLPSGDYTLRIFLEDNFDSEEIHPFTKDYADQQSYDIDFCIP